MSKSRRPISTRGSRVHVHSGLYLQPAAAITLKPVLYVAIPDIENEACDHRFVLDRAYLGELIDGLCLARDHRDMTE